MLLMLFYCAYRNIASAGYLCPFGAQETNCCVKLRCQKAGRGNKKFSVLLIHLIW